MELESTPYQFVHKPLGWVVSIGLLRKTEKYTLEVNGVKFSEMVEAPPRERADLARTAIKMHMNGPKKSAKFGFLRKGEYIGASVTLNLNSKFAKL